MYIYCPVSIYKKLSQKRIKNNVSAVDNSSSGTVEYFCFKTSLGGIMILYLLTWRPSSAGDGTDSLSFKYWY